MASTYVNNLRLEEIGTGEQSGTWGDTTNTNLKLIGQAVAWGERAITNSSNDDNITIGDGALDADRCLGLKLTGGGTACTVNLLPPTSSKTWIMYNSTAAALTFSCGSGASVIIPAGHTKVIATDGLGSGGVVHDLLTAVNLAGTTTVDDLAVTDDLVVGDDLGVTGLVTIGETLAVTGVVTANAGVVVDTMTLDAATLTATGAFTVDAGAAINLDSASGIIDLKSAGNAFAKLDDDSGHLAIVVTQNNGDIIFKGNDDGSALTQLLKLDSSDLGSAYFSHDIQLVDNAEIRFGAGNDLRISSNGSGGFIINEQGSLSIQSNNDFKLERTSAGDDYIHCIAGGAVELHHNGNKKLETAADGISVTGDVLIAAGGTLDIFNSGNTAATLTALLGADNGGGNGRTNSTVKSTVVGVPHYTNSEEPVALFVAGSTASSNFIEIGGGAGIINAATTVSIRTAANQTTTGGTTRLTVENNGDVTVEDGNLIIGTAGHGIDFSAQASANSVTGVSTTAEILNHYERGTWTPGFEDSAGNAYDLSGFSNFKGQYVRIGDFVFLSFFVNDTGTLSGNTTFLKVTGFPFNIVNTLGNLTAGSVYTFGGFTGLGADDTLIFRTQVNSATGFVQVVSGGTGRNVTQADFGGAMSTAFTFSYRCV